jgi:enoyl-CoA hydratase/carnithine racemase
VTVIRLERPEALNALSGALADELASTFKEVARDADTWVVVVAAAGDRAFCVGADLKERATLSLEDFARNRTQIDGLFSALRAVPQPTIASIFGHALGGGFELALCCDLVVAAEDTQLALPETRVGLVPGGGGTQLLARRIGLARAKELIFTGRRMGAAEASEVGVATRVVPRAELERATSELAAEICRSSPFAVREAKAAVDGGLGLPVDLGLALEDRAWRRTIATQDRAEGISAFVEKRPPRWRNG